MKSMTGYGKSQKEINGKTFQIEIRSINSKTFDFSCRLPSAYREWEAEIRNRVSCRLLRGKIDLALSVLGNEAGGPVSQYRLNSDQLKSYCEDIRALRPFLEQQRDTVSPELTLDTLLQLPGASVEIRHEEPDPAIKDALFALLDESLDKIDASREEEGAVLMRDFENRVKLIEAYAREVEPYEAQRVPLIRQRLEKTLEEIAENKFDRNRLEQEMIFYLEKLDITEEKVRLHKHCRYFTDTMREEASGRKLGFIAQEMGREINTLGSKANEATIQKIVVQMKDELEKIKEQLSNIL